MKLWLPPGKHVHEMYTPLNPTFIEKMGCAGFTYFHILLQNIDCGYSLELLRRGGSNVYPQCMFLVKLRKIKKKNLLKIFIFLNLRKICILHGRLFVMPIQQHLSRCMGKTTICICENKGTDQLRGNREADQCLCFRYKFRRIPLLLKSEISSF